MELTVNQWLTSLQTAILNSNCRVEEKDTDLAEALTAVQDRIIAVREKRKTVWWVGNGGSSAICSHLSQDLLNKLGVRSLSFSDAPLITCMANDYGYENVYARPLGVLLSEGDLVIAISSSGNSKNILQCVELAASKQADVVALSSFDPENRLRKMRTAVSIHLPAELYGIAEVGHEALIHAALETLYLRLAK